VQADPPRRRALRDDAALASGLLQYGSASVSAGKNGVLAVIFDFGGVFTTSPFEAFARFEAERGLSPNIIRTINAANPHDNAWARFERAEISAAEFDVAFAAEARERGCEIRGSEVLPLLSGDMRPRMAAALKSCKSAGFKVGCITNNVQAGVGAGMAGTDEKAAAVAAIMSGFDQVIESSKAGVRKPDPRIYEMMCALLEVEPQACVYLDDLGINCKPAAALGMKAIKVVTEAQALDDLAKITGLTFT
jgi:putative hydrolase of the HAD superfamily